MAENKREKNPPKTGYCLGASLWLLGCTLTLITFGVLIESLWSLALITPTFLLFLLSILKPPPHTPKTNPLKKSSVKPLLEHLNKAGLGLNPPKEEPITENFWSKRTFNDD